MKCDEVKNIKSELRRKMRLMLKNMNCGEREKASAAAAMRLLSLDCIKKAHTVLAYMAMKTEADPKMAVDALISEGKRMAFPLCLEGYALALYVPNTPDSFVKGMYGIMEPDPSTSTLIQFDEIDAVIVPGVAFDKNLNRLGQGAGYYDRLLAGSNVKKVGFAFDAQIAGSVEAGEFDVKMDIIVTEKGIYC